MALTSLSLGASQQVATSYPVFPFTEAMRTVPVGMRCCIIRWKSKKDVSGKEIPARSAVAVHLPLFNELPLGNALNELFQDAFELQQDLLVRSLIEEHLQGSPNLSAFSLTDAQVGRNAVVAFHAAGAGAREGKLSKEQITTWFRGTLADSISAAFLGKMGITDDAQVTPQVVSRIEGAVSGYSEAFGRLSAPSVRLKMELLSQLEKALDLVPQEDTMAARLRGVINKARNTKEPEGLLELL